MRTEKFSLKDKKKSAVTFLLLLCFSYHIFFWISFFLSLCLLSSLFLFPSLFDLFFLSCYALKLITSLQFLKDPLKLFNIPSVKLRVAHLVKQFPFFYKPKTPLPSSQVRVTLPLREQVQSSTGSTVLYCFIPCTPLTTRVVKAYVTHTL